MVLPRDEAARDRGDLRVRARGGRRRRRRRCRSRRSAARLEELRAALDDARRRIRCSSRSPTRASASAFRASALAALVDGGLQDLEQTRYADFDELRGYCEKVAGAVGVACVAGVRLRRRRARGDARDRAAADQHHARRRRGPAARPRLPAAGRARARSASTRARRLTPEWRELMAFQAAARARAPRRGAAPARLARPAQRALRRRPSPASTAATLDRIEANGFDVFGATMPALDAGEARGRRAGARADEGGRRRRRPRRARRGARPRRRRRGGDAATRRGRRSAAPCRRCRSARAIPSRRPTTASTSRSAASPSTCASSTGSARAARILRTRLALPVIDEDGVGVGDRAEPRRRCCATGTCRCATGCGSRSSLARLRDAQARAGRDVRRSCCAGSARPTRRSTASGTSSSGRRSTSAPTRSTPTPASSPCAPRCSGRARTRDLVLPLKPLGGCTATRRGACSATAARLDDARRVARRARRRRDRRRRAAARERAPARRAGARRSRTRRSSASTSGSTGRCSTPPLAALLGSDAHWVFDRGALTGHEPERGQYLTVVSSGVPELLEMRGRELVDRIAGQLTERLGDAELLWSRVSREPYATIALRPGRRAARRRDRPRPNVVRAGAWTDTGWPATMESAVRSGRAAAQHILSTVAARVTA